MIVAGDRDGGVLAKMVNSAVLVPARRGTRWLRLPVWRYANPSPADRLARVLGQRAAR